MRENEVMDSDVLELTLCPELRLKPNRLTVYIPASVAIMKEVRKCPSSALNTVVSFILSV
jgi:hypothetical protein